MKAYTRKQKVIAKSSAETELYAAALGASEAKGVQSMMRVLGFAVKPVLNIDAKAREHFLDRQGIGKLKHTDVAYLWVQDEIRSQRLRLHRVRSEENVTDLGTKPLSKAVIEKNCASLSKVCVLCAFSFCSIVHRLDTVALLHTSFPCFQTCQTHLTILPTHSRCAIKKHSCI